MKPSILIVEDDHPTRNALRTALAEEGYTASAVESGEAAVRLLQQGATFSAVVSDVVLGDGMNGVDLLRRIKLVAPETVVLLVTGFGTVETAVEAIKIGAYDFFTKPLDLDRLLHALERGLGGQRLASENRLLKQQLRERFSASNIVGRSRVLMRLLEDLERVAASDASVLLTGESGVGKDLFAAAIHQGSERSDHPFVCVSCPSLTEAAIEAELFGASGAASGPLRGRFELADRGTLFLDEIGDLGPGVQARLLRVIEQQGVERGGTSPVRVDVRVVGSTNRDIDREVAEGRFRMDLFYRLSVFRLHIPPLRERPEDIPLLVEHFLQEANRRHRREVKGVTAEAMSALSAHAWPGNVRELRNYVERALVLCRGDRISVDDLPTLGDPEKRKLTIPLGTPMEEVEKQFLLATLEVCHGNKARAARMLSMSLRTLYRRLESLGIGAEGRAPIG